MNSKISFQDDDQSSDTETQTTNSAPAQSAEQGPAASAAGPMPPIAGLKPVSNADKPLLR